MELKPPEKLKLRELVDTLLTVIANDDTGVTWDLEDLALICKEILEKE